METLILIISYLLVLISTFTVSGLWFSMILSLGAVVGLYEWYCLSTEQITMSKKLENWLHNDNTKSWKKTAVRIIRLLFLLVLTIHLFKWKTQFLE